MPREVHDEVYLNEIIWVGRKYFDHPDGEDLMGKLSFTTRVAIAAGSVAGAMYAASQKTLRGKMMRLMTVLAPTVAMSTIYTCTTFYSTRLRKKDDLVNHAIGGVAAGTMLGPIFGLPYALGGITVWTLIGVFSKADHMYNLNILGSKKKSQLSPYYIRKLDNSLTAYRPGNWSKEPPAN